LILPVRRSLAAHFIKRSLLFILLTAPLQLQGLLPLLAEQPFAARVPPLFWYESDPQTQRQFFMALMLYWSSRDSTGGFNLLAPLYYYSQSPKENIRVLLPFHFHYKSKDYRVSLWGPYMHKKSLRAQTRFVFPLYFNKRTPGLETTYSLLYYRQKDKKADTRIAFPLFWSIRSLQPGKKSYQVFIPFYFRKKSITRESFLSPLFWKLKTPEISQGIVPPYVWHYKDNKKVEIGFPLYWRFWKKKEDQIKEVRLAVPWFKVRTNDNNFRGFFPIYWGRTKVFEEEISSPTVKQGQKSLKAEWDLLLPFFMRNKKPDGSSKMVTPLFSRFRDKDGKVYGHTAVNFFTRDIWGGKTEVLFPFFLYREEQDFYKFRLLMLFFERHKNKEHSQVSLFPVFRYRRDTDRRQFLTLGFYRDKDPERSRGFLFPYFWKTEKIFDEKESDTIIRKRFLFPLLWHFQTDNRKTTVLLPALAFHSRPNYKLSLAAPFYFRRTKGADTLTIIPPFITRRSPDRKWWGLLFFYMQKARDDSRSIALLPLFRMSRFPNGHSLYLPGIYYLKEAEKTQGVIGPYLWDHRGKTQYEIMLPVYWYFKRPSWQVKTLLPFYSVKTKQLREEGFFPLVAVSKSVNPSTDTPKHFLADSHRILPFYFYRKLDRGSDLWLPFIMGRVEKGMTKDNKKRVRGRLLLVNYWEKSPDHFVSRLDPVYSYRRTPDSKGFSVPTAPLPLWQYEKSGLKSKDNQSTRGAVFPYYWKTNQRSHRKVVLPVFYRRRDWSVGGETETVRTTWLLNYFSQIKMEEQKKIKLFVPLYWHFAAKDESRTILPPLWLEKGPNFKKEILFPFWWFFEKDQDSTSLFFPLLFRSVNKKTKSKTVIAPGMWSSKDREGSTMLLGPIYRRKNNLKQESVAAVFPIYWSSRSPERRSLTVFPLYWKWAMGKRSVTYLFPIYFKHKRENLKWSVTFPIYWNFKTEVSDVKIIPPYFSIYYPSSGRPSLTAFKVLGSANGLTYVEVYPKTGRTHQIRVHLAEIGFPVLGDGVYGKGNYGRMMLHATQITIEHPRTKKKMKFCAPFPADFLDTLKGLKLKS